jgi:hypothetical protein
MTLDSRRFTPGGLLFLRMDSLDLEVTGGFPPAALPGETGYGGSETEQVDRPFSMLMLIVINRRAYHWLCCNAQILLLCSIWG